MYEAIFRRRSVRKYSDKKLSRSFLDKLDKYTDDLDKLYGGININTHIVDSAKIHHIISGIIGSYGKIKAPHYMVVTSENKEGYLENVGFAIEPLILKLTTAGIGTCWIGGHVPKGELEDILDIKKDHETVILISFGQAEKRTLRNKKKAKRKDISKITIGNLKDGWKKFIECAKYAPSALNTQPWRFKTEKDRLHAYSIKRSRFTKMITGDLHLLHRIDVGIALSHIKIGGDKFGDDLFFKDLKNISSSKKLKYVTSVIKK